MAQTILDRSSRLAGAGAALALRWRELSAWCRRLNRLGQPETALDRRQAAARVRKALAEAYRDHGACC